MTKWEDRTPIERLQVAASGSYYHEEIQWGIDRIAELETQLAAVSALPDQWDHEDTGYYAEMRQCAAELREALAGEKDDG